MAAVQGAETADTGGCPCTSNPGLHGLFLEDPVGSLSVPADFHQLLYSRGTGGGVSAGVTDSFPQSLGFASREMGKVVPASHLLPGGSLTVEAFSGHFKRLR